MCCDYTGKKSEKINRKKTFMADLTYRTVDDTYIGIIWSLCNDQITNGIYIVYTRCSSELREIEISKVVWSVSVWNLSYILNILHHCSEINTDYLIRTIYIYWCQPTTTIHKKCIHTFNIGTVIWIDFGLRLKSADTDTTEIPII